MSVPYARALTGGAERIWKDHMANRHEWWRHWVDTDMQKAKVRD